jgi:hypothetical protein
VIQWGIVNLFAAGIIIAEFAYTNSFHEQIKTPAIVILTRPHTIDARGGVLADCIVENDKETPIQVVCS